MVTIRSGMPRSVADALWPDEGARNKPNTGVSISLTPAPKMVTVSVDDTVIRFVAFEGRRIVNWASVDMYGDDLTMPKAFEKYAGRFNRKIVDLPFYAPLVRFMEKPEVKRRFVDPVIRAQTVATIPFEQAEVDIAWTPIGTGKYPTVMVTSVPKREVDAVVDLANLANVKPTALYSKATALALAAGVPNAVVAHLSQDSADLVLVRDDLAKTVHRVSIPGVDDPEASASVLAQAIDELTAFELENIEAEGAREVDAVVLTGAMTAQEPVIKAVRSMLGQRIRSVSPRVAYPDDFPASQYAINIGLALADWSVQSTSWRRNEGVRIRPTDLLPERHRIRTIPKRASQVALVFTAVTALVISTIFGAGQAQAGVERLETGVVALERQARVDAAQAARLNREQAQVTSLLGQIEAISKLKEERQAIVDTSIERLSAMTIEAAVGGVSPTDIGHSRGKVTITASATSIDQALAFADSLRQTGLFTTVTLTDVSSGGRGSATIFTVNLEAVYPYAEPTADGKAKK